MSEWFQGLASQQFAAAALWTFAALILLVIVLVIIRLVRSMTFGTFVAGGRNRKTRLAVMDATAVDSHRRLVLVRRDDIEHLLLIGGPTDVVVERDIRLGQPRRAALTGNGGHEAIAPQQSAPAQPAPAPAPSPRPRATEPAPQRAASPQPVRQPERSHAPAAPTSRPQARDIVPQLPAPAPAPRAAPPRLPVAAPASPTYASNSAPAPRYAAPPPPAPSRNNNSSNGLNSSNSLDDTLLRELEVTFDSKPPPRKPSKPAELSLDEEMTKLLGELSNQKR